MGEFGLVKFTCNESVPLLLYSTVTGLPAVTRIVVGPTIFGGTAPVGGEEVIEMNYTCLKHISAEDLRCWL